jgi:hypothetical protein
MIGLLLIVSATNSQAEQTWVVELISVRQVENGNVAAIPADEAEGMIRVGERPNL